MTWVELLMQSAWRASIILAAAFAAAAGLRRASAAMRHFVWTAALAAIVVLPTAVLLAPKWSWRVAPAEHARSAVVVTQQQAGPIVKNTGSKTTGTAKTGAHARASARIPVAERGGVRNLELGKAVERVRGAWRPRLRLLRNRSRA